MVRVMVRRLMHMPRLQKRKMMMMNWRAMKIKEFRRKRVR